MGKPIYIICHPGSGNGKGGKLLKAVTDCLKEFHLDYLTYLTDYQNHAQLLCQQLVKRTQGNFQQAVIIIGGDGTLHEVINGFLASGYKVPLAYLPAGTGNDFARVWSPKLSPRQLVENLIYQRKISQVPIIKSYNNANEHIDYMLNGNGYGLDAQINYQAQVFQKMPLFQKFGLHKLVYLAGLVKSLSQIQRFQVELKVDGQSYHFNEVGIHCTMTNPYLGGGIYLSNLTQPEEKLLCAVTYHDITLKAVFDAIKRVFLSKDHDQSPYISQIKGKQMQVMIQEPVWGQADGEVISKDLVNVSYEMDTYPFILNEEPKS